MNAQTCFRHFSGPVLKPTNHTRKFLPAKITLTNLPVGDSFRFAKKCVCRDLLTAKRFNADQLSVMENLSSFPYQSNILEASPLSSDRCTLEPL